MEARKLIREVHPEVCFWAWANGRPMEFSKKEQEGKEERLRLAEAWLGPQILSRARETMLRKVADDDILDAIAALWTATRVAEGKAKTLPEHPPADTTGLPMQIVY